ncbi:hypothetical protein MANES_13G143800v8 [Manihot esculenta]|uniref:Uncharacterized protein n=1 Tax=Manihot esculenta TaxID=3983 RepID=A0ACB7GM86_MANES|nr:hypothetical protein MANES_13G143800v8 [Manihot esculenta]
MGEYPNCYDVAWGFLPCVNFLVGFQETPSYCCNQIKFLNKIAKQNNGQKRICKCIEEVVYECGHRLVSSRVDSLANICGVKPGFPISNSMDCNT